MSLIWGWGPFSIQPHGAELLLADNVRDAFREHRASVEKGGEPGQPSIEACERLQSAIEQLWDLVAKRVQPQGDLEVPQGGVVRDLPGPPAITVVESKNVPLVRNLIEASLVASLVGIEYEMQTARLESARFPTEATSPAAWQVTGQATETATHRKTPGFGFSDNFECTDRNAVEAAFLVAASRAYVDAVEGIVPFIPGRK